MALFRALSNWIFRVAQRALLAIGPPRARLRLLGLASDVLNGTEFLRLATIQRLPTVIDQEVAIFTIPEGIASAEANALTADGALVAAASFELPYRADPVEWRSRSRLFDRSRTSLLPRHGRHKGALLTLTLGPQFRANYFHWLFDGLPRLLLVEHAEVDFSAIFVRQEVGVERESLGLMGYEKVPLIDSAEFRFVRAARLVVPPFLDAFAHFPRWSVNDLRSRLLKAVEESETVVAPRRSKLYISRLGASQRRLQNEERLCALLSARGFTIIRCETMTFRQQVREFAAAEIVVGLHGAGLSNILFCSRGTRVVEIVPPRYQFPAYQELALAVGLQYERFLGIGVEVRDRTWEYQAEDVLADQNGLCALLDRDTGTVNPC